MCFVRTAFFGVIGLAAASVLAQAQGNISGYWLMEMPREDGTVRKVFLNLHQQGGSLDGSVIENFHANKFKGGTYSDGKFSFEIKPWRQIVDTFSGTQSGDQLKVTITHKGQPNEAPEVHDATAEEEHRGSQ